MTENQKLREALQDFEKVGTGFDTCPTRRLPQSEEARRVDEWWLRYFMEADLAVRVRARQALATTEPEPTGMPELPEPAEYFVFAGLDWHRAIAAYFNSCSGEKLALYTADQMRAYGEQCWKAGYDLGKSTKNL